MTGMDIARKIQLPDGIIEAVYAVQPLDVPLDLENPQKTLEALEAFAEQDNGLKILRFYLDWAVKLKERYDAIGIPEQVFWDGMRDLAIWAEDYYDKHGVPGFAEWGWVATTLSLKVFRLGRLQFEPMELEAAIVCDGHTYPEGTMVLNVHIPAGQPLDVAQVRAAMDYAPVFFDTYFRKTFTLFHCHSWLMAPELESILKPGSRITAFSRKYLRYPIPTQGEDVFYFVFLSKFKTYDDMLEDTSLRRALKQRYLKGEYLYEYGGIFTF
jgi:hypothetical protein